MKKRLVLIAVMGLTIVGLIYQNAFAETVCKVQADWSCKVADSGGCWCVSNPKPPGQ